MKTEGKLWPSGVFILDRIMRYNGEVHIKDTRTIKITGNLVEELFLDGKEFDEGEKIRKIIFKSRGKGKRKGKEEGKVLMWKYNSKLGLLFEKHIQPAEPKLEESIKTT